MYVDGSCEGVLAGCSCVNATAGIVERRQQARIALRVDADIRRISLARVELK
jgi:hypothetical protein